MHFFGTFFPVLFLGFFFLKGGGDVVFCTLSPSLNFNSKWLWYTCMLCTYASKWWDMITQSWHVAVVYSITQSSPWFIWYHHSVSPLVTNNTKPAPRWLLFLPPPVLMPCRIKANIENAEERNIYFSSFPAIFWNVTNWFDR